MTIMETTSQATVEEARARADRIRAGLDSVHYTRADIIDAYHARDWSALGYDSWTSYVEAEFVDSTRMRLPREERRELVASLRDAGMSTRAISSATGVSDYTVRQDIKAGARNLAPDDDGTAGARNLAPEPDDEPSPVTGLDGKTYTASKRPETDLISQNDIAELNGDAPEEPIEAEIVDDDQPSTAAPAPKPRRKAIADTARSLAVDGRSWARRLQRLIDDDRLGRNREAVGGALRAELDEVRRVVDQAQAAIDSGQ